MSHNWNLQNFIPLWEWTLGHYTYLMLDGTHTCGLLSVHWKIHARLCLRTFEMLACMLRPFSKWDKVKLLLKWHLLEGSELGWWSIMILMKEEWYILIRLNGLVTRRIWLHPWWADCITVIGNGMFIMDHQLCWKDHLVFICNMVCMYVQM